MEHGILLSGADNIDFMIHGVFKYSFFGHEVWITTTHVCVLIVMLLIIGFAIAANRQMAKAREVPEGFQNVVELIVEKLDATLIFTYGIYGGERQANWLSLFIIGFFGAFVSVLGDLSFSLIKRSCHIKDFGSVIPGHGGILDRFDSVIFTAPFVYMVTMLLPIVS